MLNKKGQVTIFIIIAVIVVALVALYFIFKDSYKVGNIPSETESIYTNILSCLEETTENGIEYVSLHGGYYNVPEKISISYFEEDVPYYYLDSKKIVPSISRVEKELSDYIFDNLRLCLNFNDYEDKGFKITEGDLLVYSKIEDELISINLDYPLTIKKSSTTRLREFKIEIYSNAKKLLDSSNELVDDYMQEPGFICLTCLDDLSEKDDIEIEVTPVQDVTIFENHIIWFSLSERDNFLQDKLELIFIVEQ